MTIISDGMIKARAQNFNHNQSIQNWHTKTYKVPFRVCQPWVRTSPCIFTDADFYSSYNGYVKIFCIQRSRIIHEITEVLYLSKN
jgi:hypothetical protein